jgi:hypothetical protein
MTVVEGRVLAHGLAQLVTYYPTIDAASTSASGGAADRPGGAHLLRTLVVGGQE